MLGPGNGGRQGLARWWGLAFAAWFAVLYILSDRALPEVPGGWDWPGLDKAAHCLWFAGGGVLLSGCLPRRLGTRAAVLTATAGLVLTGLFDEWHQLSTPGRQGGDWGDLLADGIGGFLGAAFFQAVARFRPGLRLGRGAADRLAP